MSELRVFEEAGVQPGTYRDLHITRMMHGFVVVADGAVVKVCEPRLRYCPLVKMLYERARCPDGREMAEMVAEMTREKIERFGHFTERREILRDAIAVPFGTSEMAMHALRRGMIDAVVVVCDGAGTVVATNPAVVQGIGARMNGLFYTSPIPSVIAQLEEFGSTVVAADEARIDQAAGVREAAARGARSILVTVNGYIGEDLGALRDLEREEGIDLTIAVVCTTGASRERVEEIRDMADIAWSCASGDLRELAGPAAIVQVTSAIPIFVLTERGLRFLAAYAGEGDLDGIGPPRQYLIAGNAGGRRITLGEVTTSIVEAALPVRSAKEPKPLA